MPVRLGPAIFENHISIEILPKKWTDTFLFPVRHDRALPPWNYAEVVKTVIKILSLERTRLLNSHHRSRSRQWPKWLSLALPHAEIYAGWNEMSILGPRARPDALAWGKIHGVETLFWLEVESGRFSRNRMVKKQPFGG